MRESQQLKSNNKDIANNKDNDVDVEVIDVDGEIANKEAKWTCVVQNQQDKKSNRHVDVTLRSFKLTSMKIKRTVLHASYDLRYGITTLAPYVQKA